MSITRSLAAALLACAVALPVAAAESVYYADLSGANESPPNASPGTGWARVTIDFGSTTMRVEASFSGLLGTSTASHIHCCTASPDSGNAGVATQTPTFVGFPLGVTSGSYDNTFDMTLAGSYNAAFITANGGTPGSAFDALTAGLDANRAYFNLHSSEFGGGEIRGFLHPVPEPETYALMLLGLAAVGAVTRRQRARAS
ncbi:MAG: CHRD domain-containing protein [Burkholderiaceae bacterium]|nr:CHRD domain-containing protein [Burkholderiaceae bacterium]